MKKIDHDAFVAENFEVESVTHGVKGKLIWGS